MSAIKNIGGRPGVIVLFVKGAKRKWRQSRKPVKVIVHSLSESGGEIESEGKRFRMGTMPGFPYDGEFRFSEVRTAGLVYPKGHDPVTGLNDDGMNPADAAMLRDIIEHGRIAYMSRGDVRLADCVEEFCYLHRRDEVKARKFYRLLVLENWESPDRDEMLSVKAYKKRLEREMEPTVEQLAEWKKGLDAMMAETLPPMIPHGLAAEIEAFEI